MSQQISQDRTEASKHFGAIIHRCAVRIGSKTKLGKLAGGLPKTTVQAITAGGAHMYSPRTLRSVANAVDGVVHSDDMVVLFQLIPKITEVDKSPAHFRTGNVCK